MQQQKRTIIGYLNDKITSFMMNHTKDPGLTRLKIEGDLVSSFFDNVDKLKDSTLYTFIEDLKREIDLIMQILYSSPNEIICFFTYLIVMLRRLNPIDHSYINIVHMCKNLAREVNEDVLRDQEVASIS
jgi:hypothetical protein